MTFVHDDPDFAQLLALVARETGVDAALVEKDYWVTHCLWALDLDVDPETNRAVFSAPYPRLKQELRDVPRRGFR